MLEISRKEVENAEHDAIVIINEYGNVCLVINRNSDGGIDDERIKPGCCCFPVDFAKESLDKNNVDFIGGDWTTIPYVKCGRVEVETEADYYSFTAGWID